MAPRIVRLNEDDDTVAGPLCASDSMAARANVFVTQPFRGMAVGRGVGCEFELQHRPGYYPTGVNDECEGNVLPPLSAISLPWGATYPTK